LTDVEWANDNNHLLLQHTYSSGSEFVMISRGDPSSSFNINKLFKTSPTQIALQNKKIDQLYFYDAVTHTIRLADINSGTLSPVLVTGALDFKVIDNNMFLFVTENAKPGEATAKVWDNGKVYPIYSFSAGTKYLIDAAQFQGHWYYVLGSDTADRVNVYKDPIDSIKDPTIAKAIPMLAFHMPGATKVSFSANTRFVGIENGQQFGVYDFETLSQYQYTISAPLAAPMKWMDGHRFIGTSNGTITVMDYDSTNSQVLVPTALTVNDNFFSRDYNQLFTIVANENGGSSLQHIDMRAGVDLPKNP
jgi:hypothetical protein